MKESKKPPWLRKRIPLSQDLIKVNTILGETDLHTVCEEARCTNLGECFARGTATMIILGKICTRRCGFCAVQHGIPTPPDESEPQQVAKAVQKMGLQYVVVTSVTRDARRAALIIQSLSPDWIIRKSPPRYVGVLWDP
jgi:lipoic acid synthetase